MNLNMMCLRQVFCLCGDKTEEGRLANRKRGFTLIEIIVSAAIFTIVVTVAIGALTSLNKASREARALRVVMDNANSAIDSMSRTIRMGIRFDCGCLQSGVLTADCRMSTTVSGEGSQCLRFQGPSGLSGTLQEMTYAFDAGNKRVTRKIGVGGVTEVMTAPEIEVTDMRFYVNGTTPDNDQPVVTMLMTGIARVSRAAKPFTVQTTVSPRTPNSILVTP